MQHLTLRILQILHEEHMNMVSLLERFEALLEKHGPASPPPPDDAETLDVLGKLETLLKIEISNHYNFEESQLFTRFATMGGEGIAMMLKDEHDTIRPLAVRITELTVGGPAEVITVDAWREFHELGTELAEREIFHVQKEEMGFLPGLQQFLDPSEDQELVDIYKNMKNGG